MTASTARRFVGMMLCTGFLALASAFPAAAQTDPPPMPSMDEGSSSPIPLTLNEAVRIALNQNYDLRRARLDVRNADAQVREAWGSVYPQIDVTGGYTRNIVTANPFAGSDVTGLFAGGNSTDWVAFNERARTDDDPSTMPITFQEFRERQQEAREAAGIRLGGGGGNPFGVDNEFRSGISLTQTLFNGSAFASIAGAQQLKDVNQRNVDREAQLLADRVRQTYYDALLAQERVDVLQQRVERTQQTLQEVRRQVRQGVTPKFQRLSTEVELSNVETELVTAANNAELALDNLKNTMGLSIDQPIRLEDALEASDAAVYREVSVQQALQVALERRADLERARLAIELREVQKSVTKAQYLPTLSAVANFNYTGRVPDDRELVLSDPNDPFAFSTQNRGFFEDSFWNPSFSVGLQMSWNIFSGFQTAARVEQDEVAVRRAEVDYLQLQEAVELDVRRALSNLEAARQRIQNQQQNVSRAETNYQFASERVQQGVSSQLELREASDQLDQTRLNYLQAVHDYLTARSAFEAAVGLPVTMPDDSFQFTSR
jgi:outer membrane protein TolC